MNDRAYLFFIGLYILCSVYFEVDLMIYGLSALLLIEGVTGWSLPLYLQKLRSITLESGLVVFQTKNRFAFDGLRAWRFSVVAVLVTSYVLLNQYDVKVLWFIPWFMGFAIMSAGLSSVCPMVLFIRWLGFR